MFFPKYCCANCVYLQKKSKPDAYNETSGIELSKAEREKIKKGIDIELDKGESFKCYRHQWISEYNTEPEKKENYLTRKRKKCKKEDYFYPYSPGKDLHQLRKEHDIKRSEKIPIFMTPGWGWKLATLLLTVLSLFLTSLIGLVTANLEFREWFFSLFGN